MCTNYEPFLDPTFAEKFAATFGARLAPCEFRDETFPGYAAPVVRNIVRKQADGDAGRECLAARFGLVPNWAKAADVARPRLKFATHNARAETAGRLPSFRHAWSRRQYCLIPVQAFYEPCWQTGKAVRWKIWLASGEPFALAGIWEHWQDGVQSVDSFSMLTVNADDHELMRQMHRPGEEKRMPVILHGEDHDRWLNASTEEAFHMCQQFPAGLMRAAAAPKVRKETPALAMQPSMQGLD
jgi:putative SOS response-associated peptidase YedK